MASTIDGFVDAAIVFDGELVISGIFATVDGVMAPGVARWDGATWRPLGSGMAAASGPAVVIALLEHHGDLIAGGSFVTAGGVAARNIARWDGAAWGALGEDISGGSVRVLAAYQGTLYAGGNFTIAGANCLVAAWDGVSWQPLSTGRSDDFVAAMAVYHDELYVGGQFPNIGGVPVSGLARWNGEVWQPVSVPLVRNQGTVFVSALRERRGELVAAGAFSMGGSTVLQNIGRWNGVGWAALGSGLQEYTVNTLSEFNSELIVGGTFLFAGGAFARDIARWDGAAWRTMRGGIVGSQIGVRALCLFQGDLVAGGGFTNAGGNPFANLARWRNGEGDATNDDRVDFFDLNAVLSGFGQSGPPGAVPGDVNNDGVCDFCDLCLVLAAYGESC